MKILTLLSASLLVLSCGLDEEENSSANDVEVGSDVNFSGYVQRAFEIRVNDYSFSDTEHFYTNFVSDLIMSREEYSERFKDATIEVEGEYGLERFGSNGVRWTCISGKNEW